MKWIKRDGFWRARESDRKDLPFPVANVQAWDGMAEFLLALSRIEAVAECATYRGMSRCRICDKWNGNEEYTYKDWIWPEGFSHYVRDHNVMPSSEFKEFVLLEDKS